MYLNAGKINILFPIFSLLQVHYLNILSTQFELQGAIFYIEFIFFSHKIKTVAYFFYFFQNHYNFTLYRLNKIK